MKYINNREHIYMNDYGVVIATNRKLNKEQEEDFDKSFSYIDAARKFLNIVDTKATLRLNLRDYFPTKINDNNGVNSNMNLDVIIQNMKKIYGDNAKVFMISPQIIEQISDRYKHIGLTSEFIITPILVTEEEKNNTIRFSEENLSTVERLKRGNTLTAGLFDNSLKKILAKFPVMVMPKKLKDEYDLRKIKNIFLGYFFSATSLYIHEIKHALNYYNIAKVMETKQISVEDLFKLAKLQEISAETEAIFNTIRTRFEFNYDADIFDTSLSKNFYENTLKFALNNSDYCKQLDKFMPILINELTNNFLKQNVYQNNYYMEIFHPYVYFPENQTKTKSDEGVYEDLKRKMLSFEVYNPETKGTEIMDLSQYFEDPVVSTKERFLLKKQYKHERQYKRDIEKETHISNRILKKIQKLREDLQNE